MSRLLRIVGVVFGVAIAAAAAYTLLAVVVIGALACWATVHLIRGLRA